MHLCLKKKKRLNFIFSAALKLYNECQFKHIYSFVLYCKQL